MKLAIGFMFQRRLALPLSLAGISLPIRTAFCSAADANPSPAMTLNKGSFLLKAQQKDSDAKMIASPEASGNNDRIGKSLIELRNKQVGPNVAVFYKQDGGLVIVRGEGAYMIDVDGNRHLDCCNNVAHVGHAHPKVVAAGQKELANVQTNARFLNPVQQRYLEKLLATFPPELNTVYLVNSGSEANDLALRIARQHTTAKNPKDVIVLDSAYHGHTQSLVDISPYKWYQAVDGVDYKVSSTHVVPCPDSYRGPHRGFNKETGKQYAKYVQEVVDKTGGVGVFIAESIVGCGGQIVPPPGYLQECYDIVRKSGGVCIADEVQTGFGRAGSHFWVFQTHGVVPDIVTCGKPIANGYPMAAVICRREVAESFSKTGIEYFNTYAGNSVACTIAEAVIDTIHEEKLMENATVVGNYLTEQLTKLAQKYPWTGDVRGIGLFQGIEFVRDKNALVLIPHPDLTKFVVDFMRYNRVIVSRDGPDENVIKVKPPMVFSKADVDILVNSMDRALEAAQKLGKF